MIENIKQFVKEAAYWTIPPGIQSAIKKIWTGTISIGKKLRKNGVSLSFSRNAKFHNIHKGERCFILATGPSINEQELKSLKNEICFAVSMFFLHKDIREINPLYHVDAPNHHPYGFETVRKSFEGFNRFYSERTTYFFGHSHYEYSIFNFLEQNPQFKKDNIYYLDYCNLQQLDERNYKNPNPWDITKTLFLPRSVIYCAIQLAVYMGFRSIYLVGCDHNYLASFSSEVKANFYDDKESTRAQEERMSTEETLYRYYLRWKQYRLMRSYLEPRGRYIYNATQGGLLDVFPRVSLAEVLKGNPKWEN